jgi:hypothetical protein
VISVITGCFSQWRNTNGITTRIAAGFFSSFLARAFMASSGSRSRAAAGSNLRTRARRQSERKRR